VCGEVRLARNQTEVFHEGALFELIERPKHWGSHNTGSSQIETIFAVTIMDSPVLSLSGFVEISFKRRASSRSR
jgi:hypothetical protein